MCIAEPVIVVSRCLSLLFVLLAAGPSRAERNVSQRVALERVVQLLHSRGGNEIAAAALKQARAASRAGRAGTFERRLLRDARRLKWLDRNRRRFADPNSKHGWQRWNLRPLHQRAATSLLNTLGAAVVIQKEPYLPRPVRGPDCQVPYLDLGKLERSLGKGAVGVMRSLLASEDRSQPKPGKKKPALSWWTVLNGVRPRLANALSDVVSLKPHMPAVGWAVKSYGSLDGKIKGALVRWPLRGNTLALLGDTGLPLGNTVVWADKDHFTDPRVALAARKLTPQLELRGAKVDRDDAYIERWIRGNVAKLSAAELRSPRPLFLISDDGGHLIKVVARVFERRPDLRRHAHLFAGVEQTGSGSNWIARGKLPFKVVAWARSEAKTYSGALMYGYTVVSQAARNLARLGEQGVAFGREKAVVVGAGPMGRAAAHWLRYMGYKRIELYDSDPAVRKRLRLRDDKVEVLADADLVVSFSGGNHCLGADTLRSYVARGKKPKAQLWVNGGSPGEIGNLSARHLRPAGLKTDRSGVLSALWDNGRRVNIGRRSDGPDLDRFVEHKGWRVVSLRDGRVVNGQSPVGGVRHSLFERTGAMFYGELPLDPRKNDPVSGYAIQFELGMMHLAHLHALGLSNEKGATPVAGNRNLLAMPAGPGTRQHRMVFSAMALGTNLLVAEDLRSKAHFFIW
jgi:hypothetical protein